LGSGYPDTGTRISGHDAPISGHAAYTSVSRNRGLAPPTSDIGGEREAPPPRPRTVDGSIDPDAERLAREAAHWAEQRAEQGAEERERVAAMARQALASLGEVERRQRQDADAEERALAGDRALRARGAVTDLEAALANLRRMRPD
jgi:hypothetical protein